MCFKYIFNKKIKNILNNFLSYYNMNNKFEITQMPQAYFSGNIRAAGPGESIFHKN